MRSSSSPRTTHKSSLVAALLRRIAVETETDLRISVRSSTGGLPAVLGALDDFAGLCGKIPGQMPDTVVVAIDANCQGVNERRKIVEQRAGPLRERLLMAIPNPHVERWYMLDGRAFKRLVGRGCRAPDQKCEKDRYKRLLNLAIREAGVEPLLGGVEYAADLANAMDLERASRSDREFNHFLHDARRRMK